LCLLNLLSVVFVHELPPAPALPFRFKLMCDQ
jgi:hypothetical protein